MSQMIRRCTGFRPSRTSGSALDMMTDIAYSRNEFSISSWSAIGWIGSGGGVMLSSVIVSQFAFERGPRWIGSPVSEVEVADVAGIGGDELAAARHVVTHQHRGDLVGESRFLDRDLQQGPRRGVHRGAAQLFPVHLAEALQALELLLVVRPISEELGLGHVVLEVHLLLADLGGVQRRLGDV